MFKRFLSQTLFYFKKHLTFSTQYPVQPLTYLRELYYRGLIWKPREILKSSRLEILKKFKVVIEKSPVFELSTVHNFFPILLVIIILVVVYVGLRGSGGLDCDKIQNPSFGLISEYGSSTFVLSRDAVI